MEERPKLAIASNREGEDEKTNPTQLEHDEKSEHSREGESLVHGGDGDGSSLGGVTCKGYLYYSSNLKSRGANPRCIGLPRAIDNVPKHIVGRSEVEASQEGHTLVDFYYACAGYSVYVKNDNSIDKQAKRPELPVCVGLELLVDKKNANASSTSAPAPVHGRQAGHDFPQTRPHRPAHSSSDDFLSRFTRNSNLVASGVAKNMRRVGNYIKHSIDDILYSYRRPK